MPTIEQQRALVVGRIWQALGRSGVDLSALPSGQQEQLVNAITDEMLMTVNEMLGQIATEQGEASTLGSDETVLWEGRPFLSLFDHYSVTTERVRIRTGALGRDHEDVELIRIQDIDYAQTLGERMFNIGDITLRSADASNSTTVLRNVHSPEQVVETLRRAWLDARKRHGVQFREQM
jgi:hypothetical protein